MPINHPDNKGTFLATLRSTLLAPKVALDNVSEFRAWLYSLASDGQTETLEAFLVSEYDFTAAEAELIVNAVNAEHHLAQTANAQATIPNADDSFFNAKKVWGFNPRRA
jgi:hypothetical protein